MAGQTAVLANQYYLSGRGADIRTVIAVLAPSFHDAVGGADIG